MQLAVLVERIDEQTYRAETAQPVSLTAEGHTREEAVNRLLELAKQRLAAGEIVHLELSDVDVPHPSIPYAGVWKDHPDFDAFLDNISMARRQLDQTESEKSSLWVLDTDTLTLWLRGHEGIATRIAQTSPQQLPLQSSPLRRSCEVGTLN